VCARAYICDWVYFTGVAIVRQPYATIMYERTKSFHNKKKKKKEKKDQAETFPSKFKQKKRKKKGLSRNVHVPTIRYV